MTRVQDIMTRGVRTLRPSDSVVAAAQTMDELNVGALPVCQSGKLVGMVTDRDITVRAVARGRADAGTILSDVMSSHVSWCYEDQPLEQVVEQMSDWQIRRVPVMDRSEQLVGMLSLGDIAVKGDADQAAQCLMHISEPARPHHLWPPQTVGLTTQVPYPVQSGSKPRNRQAQTQRPAPL
ncbi:MAG: CBS domain-containing protein [Betaproteobacteria bacterium]|nr:CBS domain-containing protein [Betaproteobacteria bacterium]